MRKVLIVLLSLFSLNILVNLAYSQQVFSGTDTAIEKGVEQGFLETALSEKDKMKFFLILIPAAVSDSINPCEFAILLLLLSAILSKHRDRKKVFYAGILFSLAIFISYFAMGVGLYKALATASSITWTKMIVGIIGVLVGIFNIKDYFAPDFLFKMEVPDSWRPKMHKIVNSITSPWGAFGIGVVISLFLLPCTSGPYITILGYLASESHVINTWGYIYLFIYNIIFVLPMLVITFIVGTGMSSIEQLAKLRKKNIGFLHLIVGILMLGLGLYILYDIL